MNDKLKNIALSKLQGTKTVGTVGGASNAKIQRLYLPYRYSKTSVNRGLKSGVPTFLNPLGGYSRYSKKPELITWLEKHKAKFIYGDKVIGLSGQSENEATDHRPKNHITKPMLRAWKTARPWILDHLPELEAKGWTKKKLFQADRFKYPLGKWGPAWSSNWLRPEVEVSILADGAICWTWEELRGPISQTARPKV